MAWPTSNSACYRTCLLRSGDVEGWHGPSPPCAWVDNAGRSSGPSPPAYIAGACFGASLVGYDLVPGPAPGEPGGLTAWPTLEPHAWLCPAPAYPAARIRQHN